MKLALGAFVVAVVAVGCVAGDPPCGPAANGDQSAADRACTDRSSPQFHLSASACDPGYLSSSFQGPQWCEVGCVPMAPETRAPCDGASNPFYASTIRCTSTHVVDGVSGCCMAMTADPAKGLNQNAVMFFACAAP